MELFRPQDSDSGGDSGYPSERRSEGDPNDHVDGVKDSIFFWPQVLESELSQHSESSLPAEIRLLPLTLRELNATHTQIN